MGQSSRKMAISWVPIPAHDRCASSLIETLQNLMAEDSYWQGQVHWTGCFFQTQSTGKYQGYHFFYHPDLMGFSDFPCHSSLRSSDPWNMCSSDRCLCGNDRLRSAGNCGNVGRKKQSWRGVSGAARVGSDQNSDLSMIKLCDPQPHSWICVECHTLFQQGLFSNVPLWGP